MVKCNGGIWKGWNPAWTGKYFMWKYCTKRVKKENYAMVAGKGKYDGGALFKYLLQKVQKF